MKGRIKKSGRLLAALLGIAGFMGSLRSTQAEPSPKIKAIAFDAFVVFDPRPVSVLAEKLFPGKGVDLVNAWRIRQFEYTWLRTLSGTYEDFWKVSGDALDFTAKAQKLDLTVNKKNQLMEVYKHLKPWPDALAVLKVLKKNGIRLAFLTNLTSEMLQSDIKSSGMDGLFDYRLSTDSVKIYKPGPMAYRMGMDAFHLKKDEILFAAFAGWDAAGAKSFGYPTYWVNRLQLPMEELGVKPEGEGADLTDMLNFLKSIKTPGKIKSNRW